MRISDWSSDVCSSDLDHVRADRHRHHVEQAEHQDRPAEGTVAEVGQDPAERHVRGVPAAGEHRQQRARHRAACGYGGVSQEKLRAQWISPQVMSAPAGRYSNNKSVAKLWRKSHRNQKSKSSPRKDSRSEEHTSELQSLMRISYAVFCLKTKKLQTILTKI